MIFGTDNSWRPEEKPDCSYVPTKRLIFVVLNVSRQLLGRDIHIPLTFHLALAEVKL